MRSNYNKQRRRWTTTLWTTVGHALDKCVDDRYFGTCFVCDLYGALDNGFGLLVQAVRIREKGVERSKSAGLEWFDHYLRLCVLDWRL